MIIIFDFDNTLFSEPLFVNRIRERFQACGVSTELYNTTKKEAYNGIMWQQFRHMELLAEKSHVSLERLHSAFREVIAEGSTFLYPEVFSFLEQICETHSLNILTYGEDRFQRMKIAGAGIEKFFQGVIVAKDVIKTEEAETIAGNGQALFVEDNPHALEAVKMNIPHILTVRMRRGDGRYVNDPSGKGVDYEIKELAELIKFI